MQQDDVLNRFYKGLQDGLPIGLGYISVSITFGMLAVSSGIPIWGAVLISMTNLTSAGQLAGISLICAHASMLEMALTQLVINIRYALMSLSLSQKLDKNISIPKRLLIAFGNSDEIFALASTKKQTIGARYFYGLMCCPYLGWALGTLIGAVAGGLLPENVRSALGMAIYGMFAAVIVPPAKHFHPIGKVVLIAVVLSCIFAWVPGLNQLSMGFVIILCGVGAALLGAYLFPIKEAQG